MGLKVWIKANIADKALTPLRKELLSLLVQGESVLEIGCGTGDLLFNAKNKISQGYGVDLNPDMIRYAEAKSRKIQASNLSFTSSNVTELDLGCFDVATSTLCLHELTKSEACKLLKYMSNHSKRVLIADYTKPKSIFTHASMEVDEMLSGHYCNFRRYMKVGQIPEYAFLCGLFVNRTIQSCLDGITIWEITQDKKVKIY